MCVWHRAERSTAPGNIFLTPWKSSANDNAAMMLTRDGRLLWYRPYSGGVRDLKVVRYRGRRMLAYFTWGHRAYSLLDDRYREETRAEAGLVQDTRLAQFFHSEKWEALLSTHGRHH